MATNLSTYAATQPGYYGCGFNSYLQYSTDLITWNNLPKPASIIDFEQCIGTKNILVASDYEQGTFYSTNSGASWKPIKVTSGKPSTAFYKIFYIKDTGLFFATAYQGNDYYHYLSKDGINWDKIQDNSLDVVINQLIYFNQNYYAATRYGIMISKDGYAWDKVNNLNNYTSITVGNNILYAVNNSGMVLSSQDGNLWQLNQTNASNMIKYAHKLFFTWGYGSIGTMESIKNGGIWKYAPITGGAITDIQHLNNKYIQTGEYYRTSVDGYNWEIGDSSFPRIVFAVDFK